MSKLKKTTSMSKLSVLPDKSRTPDEVAKFLSKLPTRCLIHEEPANAFCVDHDQLICNVCNLSTHNQCGTVMGFDEASKGFRNSRDIAIIGGNFKKLKQKYDKMYKEQSDIYNEVIEQEKAFIKAVHAFRDEINAVLERLENSVMARKDDYVSNKKAILKNHKEQCRTASNMIESYMKDLDRSFLNGDEESIFLAIKRSKTVVDLYTEQMKVIQQSPKTVHIEFEANKQVEKFFLNLNNLGTIKTVGDSPPEAEVQLPVITRNMDRRMSMPVNLMADKNLELPFGVRLDKKRGSLAMSDTTGVTKTEIARTKTRRPILVGESSVSFDTDNDDPFITGLTFMPDDHVVCVDDANKSVKLFTYALKPVTSLKIKSVPRDIAPVKSQLVVVTIPSDKTLQFVELGKEMTFGDKLQLDIECSGVTCFQHELYVTSGFSVDRQIQVVSLKGIVRKRIRPGIADLRYPLFIAVDPKLRTLFVTDYNHGVIGIDLNSTEVQFKCKDTDVHGYYKGIAIGNKGHIYTCTWDLNGVSRVHLDGRGLETIIPMPDKEGRKPHSIAYSQKSSRLLVSMCGGKRGCLTVYRFQ